ncbi:MAG: hypothetical protein J5554_03280 [Paludibacteraceae bacterium]|nr:hypothetical protein [Paludibacteraceae bacterium]
MGSKLAIGCALVTVLATSFFSSCGRKDHTWQDVQDTITYQSPKPVDWNGKRGNLNIPLRGSLNLDSVKINYGSLYSDSLGRFKLSNTFVRNGRSLVVFEKDGYFPLVRTGLLGSTDMGNIVLQKKGESDHTTQKTFDSADGIDLDVDDCMLRIVPNSIVRNYGSWAKAYEGKVTVDLYYLSPEEKDFVDRMPGSDLAAVNKDGEEVTLLSYGMANILLSDTLGNELSLNDTMPATIVFPVPRGMKTDLATIPLWHFKESQGLWMEEGVAYRQGDLYVGKVGHFSWWNLDYPSLRSFVRGTVRNQKGQGCPGVKVVLDEDQKVCYTDQNGNYLAVIPMGKKVDVSLPLEGLSKNVKCDKAMDTLTCDFAIKTRVVSLTFRSSCGETEPFKLDYTVNEEAGDPESKTLFVEYGKEYDFIIPERARSLQITCQTNNGYSQESIDLGTKKEISQTIDACSKLDRFPEPSCVVGDTILGKFTITDKEGKKHEFDLNAKDILSRFTVSQLFQIGFLDNSFVQWGIAPDDNTNVINISPKNYNKKVEVCWGSRANAYGGSETGIRLPEKGTIIFHPVTNGRFEVNFHGEAECKAMGIEGKAIDVCICVEYPSMTEETTFPINHPLLFPDNAESAVYFYRNRKLTEMIFPVQNLLRIEELEKVQQHLLKNGFKVIKEEKEGPNVRCIYRSDDPARDIEVHIIKAKVFNEFIECFISVMYGKKAE